MQVLWWLAPPLAATFVAMCWAAWVGRERDEERRDQSDAALRRMQRALAKPAPHAGRPVASHPAERTHGVAVRRTARRPDAGAGAPR